MFFYKINVSLFYVTICTLFISFNNFLHFQEAHEQKMDHYEH